MKKREKQRETGNKILSLNIIESNMINRHNNYGRLILLLVVCFSSVIYSQNVMVDGRIFTPVEGRQMAKAYGYVTVLQGIAKLTTKKCSQWLPDYQGKYTIIYRLWTIRNKPYFVRNNKIFIDLVQLVSRSSGQQKKQIALFYRSMTSIAVKRFMTILLRKDHLQRSKFCHAFSARLASGILDIHSNTQVSIFIRNYNPL